MKVKWRQAERRMHFNFGSFPPCDLILGNHRIRMLIRLPVQISITNGRHADRIALPESDRSVLVRDTMRALWANFSLSLSGWNFKIIFELITIFRRVSIYGHLSAERSEALTAKIWKFGEDLNKLSLAVRNNWGPSLSRCYFISLACDSPSFSHLINSVCVHTLCILADLATNRPYFDVSNLSEARLHEQHDFCSTALFSESALSFVLFIAFRSCEPSLITQLAWSITRNPIQVMPCSSGMLSS